MANAEVPHHQTNIALIDSIHERNSVIKPENGGGEEEVAPLVAATSVGKGGNANQAIALSSSTSRDADAKTSRGGWCPSPRSFLLLFLVAVLFFQLGWISGTSSGVQEESPAGFYRRQDVLKNVRVTGAKATHTSPKFVFFMGLEGTGHHLVTKFAKNSPFAKRLEDLDLTLTQQELSYSLMSLKNPPSSLFSAHCASQDVDVSILADNVVRLLKRISSRTTVQEESLSVALNCIKKATMFSYPAGGRNCFQYPQIEHLYYACEKARVRCEHVYLYRDPYSVIASTTAKRHFNRSVLKAIHLYTSLLNIMFAQLAAHPNRNAGCLGFFDSNTTKKELWDPIRDLLGWKDQQSSFDEYVRRVYQPPTPLSEEQRMALVPPKLQVYMDSMIKAHDNVLRLCREQYAQRRHH